MSGVLFDPESIRTLAAILRDTALTEIELVEGDRRIRLVRAGSPGQGPAPPPAAPPAPVPAVASLATEEAIPPGAVISPMVGIAYLAPEPGATPCVTVADKSPPGRR